MTFNCRVSDQKGKISHKTIETCSAMALREYWESGGFYLISFALINKKRSLGGDKRAVLEMTRTLTLMIQSGLSLKESFETGSVLYNRNRTALLIQGIHEDLRRGESFSRALATRETLFPPLYRGMICVGEKLGRLDRILPALADWLEKDKTLRDKIGGALLYPALVMILVFSSLAALLLFFLPYMESIMFSAGKEAAENLRQAYTWTQGLVILLGVLVFLVILARLILPLVKKKAPPLALLLDKSRLGIPLIKKIILTRDLLSLSFALALLTGCGVPLEEALLQTAELMENRYLKKGLVTIGKGLPKGLKLSWLFHEEDCFPAELVSWISLGERTGRIDRVFEQLRDYYQKELDLILNRILTLAEPVLILFLGMILAVIIFQVFLPLITLYGGMP